MNVAAMQAVLTHSRSANAARMVLLVLASHSNDKGHVGAIPIPQLCAEANASERTVKYAIEELRDKLKELLAERESAGRGRTFEFNISPLLEKVQNLHASDKHADLAPIEEKGADVAPIPWDKGANNVGIDAEIAPLSDPKGADFTGTPIAPYSAKNTSKNISQPSVEAGAVAPPAPTPSKTKKVQPSKADPRTSHPAIIAVFEVTGRRPDKDLYNKIIRTLGDEPDGQRLVECFEAWRGKDYKPTNYGWITDWYVNGIPEKALNGHRSQYGQPKQANPRVDTILSYDYSAIDGPSAGEDAGLDYRQVPADEWLATAADERPTGDDRRLARSSRH
jgi:hypothetical protein